MTVKEIARAIMQLETRAEIDVVFRAAKCRASQLREEGVFDFSPGDQVSFKARRGGKLVGAVEKTNRTTVGVVVNGQLWRVSPTLLKHEAQAVPA